MRCIVMFKSDSVVKLGKRLKNKNEDYNILLEQNILFRMQSAFTNNGYQYY